MKRRSIQKKSTPNPPKDLAAAFLRRVLRGAKASLAGTTDTYTESDAIRTALSMDTSQK